MYLKNSVIIIFVLLIVLNVGCLNSSDNKNEEDYSGSLLLDVSNAKGIAWVGPHCDDDITSSELLGLASLGYHKNVYVMSLNENAMSFPPGADINDRHQDNEDFKNYLNLVDYIRLGLDGLDGDSKKQGLYNYLDNLTEKNNVNMLITFENTHGYNGNTEHPVVSNWVTEYAQENNLVLYYVINRDPIIGDGELDPLPVTDSIDLDNTYVVDTEGKNITLWELGVNVLEIYKTSVPSALNLVENQNRLNRVLHEKYYRKVN